MHTLKKANGMRVKKTKGADVTRSYYDGQIPVEEDSVVTGTSSVTRNFVGARGIEAIFTTTTSGTTTAFPLYDCHGNMVATVSRSGAGSGLMMSGGEFGRVRLPVARKGGLSRILVMSKMMNRG